MSNDNVVMVVGDDGTPKYMADVDLIVSKAVALAYRYAAAARDDEAVMQVGLDFLEGSNPEEIGQVAVKALQILAGDIFGPTLEVVMTVAPEWDFQGKIEHSRDEAIEQLG